MKSLFFFSNQKFKREEFLLHLFYLVNFKEDFSKLLPRLLRLVKKSEKNIARKKETVELLFLLSKIFLELGEFKKSSEGLQKAFKILYSSEGLKIEKIKANHFYSLFLIFNGFFDQALIILNQSITHLKSFSKKPEAKKLEIQAFYLKGKCCFLKDQYTLAENCLKKVLFLCDSHLDESFFFAGISSHYLGKIYLIKENFDLALFFLSKTSMYFRFLPKDNSNRLENNLALGDYYLNLKQPKRAKEFYCKQLKQYKVKHGRCFHRLVDVFFKIGLSYKELYQYKKTVFFLKKAIQLEKKINRWNSYKLFFLYRHLGDIYYFFGQNFKAEEAYLQAHTIKQKNGSISSLDYAFFLKGLSALYISSPKQFFVFVKPGDFFTMVEKFLHFVSRIFIEKLGDTHPKVAEIFFILGHLFYGYHKIKESLLFYQKAVRIYNCYHQSSHQKEIALGYLFLARSWIKMDAFNEFVDQMRCANEWNKKKFFKGSADQAYFLFLRSKLLVENKDYLKAKNDLEKAVKIYIQFFGKHSLFLKEVYFLLIETYLEMHQYKKALFFSKKVLRLTSFLGKEKMKERTKCLLLIGKVYLAEKKYPKAKAFLTKAVKENILMFGEDNCETIVCQSYLASLYKQIKDYQRAEIIYQRILSHVYEIKEFSIKETIPFLKEYYELLVLKGNEEDSKIILEKIKSITV